MGIRRIHLESDLAFRATQGVLWLAGFGWALTAFALPALYAFAASDVHHRAGDRRAALVATVSLATAFLVCAAIQLAAAWGLRERKSWALALTGVIGGVYTASCCLPVGIVILVAVLRSGVRESYRHETRARRNAPITF
jgi:hypothetical protein